MPIYKTPVDLLLRSFESIKNQKCKNFDLIIIINGKNENSDMIKNSFKSGINVSVIELEHNVGYCWARQIAINQSKTKYVAFLDSDDEIVESYVETFYHYTMVEDFDLIFIRFLFIKGDEKISNNKTKNCYINKMSSERLLWYPAGWSKIINREFLKKNDIEFIRDEKNIVEDLYFHLCLLYKFKKGYFIGDKIMYKYYVNKNSTINELIRTGNSSSITLENRFKFYEKYANDKGIIIFVIKTSLFSGHSPRNLYILLQKIRPNVFINFLMAITYLPFFVLVLFKKRLVK